MSILEQEIEFLKQNAEAGKTPGFKIGRAVAYAIFLFILFVCIRAVFDAPWLQAPKGFQFSSLYFDLVNYLIWLMLAAFPIGLFLGRKFFFDLEKTKGTILIGTIWFGVLVSIFALFLTNAAFFLSQERHNWVDEIMKAPGGNEFGIVIIIFKSIFTIASASLLIIFANAWLVIGEIVQRSWLRYIAAGAYLSAPISAYFFDAPWYPWLIFITLFGAIPALLLSLNQKKLEA